MFSLPLPRSISETGWASICSVPGSALLALRPAVRPHCPPVKALQNHTILYYGLRRLHRPPPVEAESLQSYQQPQCAVLGSMGQSPQRAGNARVWPRLRSTGQLCIVAVIGRVCLAVLSRLLCHSPALIRRLVNGQQPSKWQVLMLRESRGSASTLQILRNDCGFVGLIRLALEWTQRTDTGVVSFRRCRLATLPCLMALGMYRCPRSSKFRCSCWSNHPSSPYVQTTPGARLSFGENGRTELALPRKESPARRSSDGGWR